MLRRFDNLEVLHSCGSILLRQMTESSTVLRHWLDRGILLRHLADLADRGNLLRRPAGLGILCVDPGILLRHLADWADRGNLLCRPAGLGVCCGILGLGLRVDSRRLSSLALCKFLETVLA